MPISISTQIHFTVVVSKRPISLSVRKLTGCKVVLIAISSGWSSFVRARGFQEDDSHPGPMFGAPRVSGVRQPRFHFPVSPVGSWSGPGRTNARFSHHLDFGRGGSSVACSGCASGRESGLEVTAVAASSESSRRSRQSNSWTTAPCIQKEARFSSPFKARRVRVSWDCGLGVTIFCSVKALLFRRDSDGRIMMLR